jgi:hypothetical protein
MTRKILTTVLAAAITAGPLAAPALADGAASTRNILIGIGAAAAVAITNYNHKKRVKQAEQQQTTRRQASYRAYFYHKYGYYPTDQQFRDWYVRTYGVEPS